MIVRNSGDRKCFIAHCVSGMIFVQDASMQKTGFSHGITAVSKEEKLFPQF
jgi:hypothetical protein